MVGRDAASRREAGRNSLAADIAEQEEEEEGERGPWSDGGSWVVVVEEEESARVVGCAAKISAMQHLNPAGRLSDHARPLPR